MFIFGFPITEEDSWDEDPFLSDGKLQKMRYAKSVMSTQELTEQSISA